MKNRKNVCKLLKRVPRYCVNVPCERCILGKLYDLRDRPLKNGVYVYGKYTLEQYPSGDYCIINTEARKWVVHAQCTRQLTRREAREHIQFYLKNKR